MGLTHFQAMHDPEVPPTQCSMSDLSDTQHQIEYGGADRDRTGGLLVANQALSQLSYSPH
jgi:hypothetical protein